MFFLRRTWSGRRGAELTREARLTEKTKTIILKLFMKSTKSSYFGKSLAERQSLHWKHFEAWMPLDIRFVPIVLQDFVSKVSSISNQQKTDREQSLLNTDAVTNGFGAQRWWTVVPVMPMVVKLWLTLMPTDTTWVLQSSWLQRFACCALFGEWHKKDRSPPYLQCRAHAWQEK